MADINLSPYSAEQQAMDRRRKMAEAMQQQAVSPIEIPTTPGVKISPWQGLAKIFQGYLAGKNLSRSDQEQKDYELATNRDMTKILNLPFGQQSPVSLTGDVEAKPDPLIPLSLTGNDLGIETGTGRYALLQALMQQKQQQQAAAQRALEAQKQIHIAKPGETAFQLDASGKPVTVMNPPAQPKWEHTSKFVNGQEVTGWVNTNAPDIPGSFVQGAIKPEMTESQRLDAQLKQYAAEVEAAKSLDVGRKSIQFQALPKGVPVGAKRVGKTPDGKDVYELNGKKFVGD